MDQESEFWNTAKEILNHQNKTPYSDQEIKEIVNFLENISGVICHNLIHKN
ncbi:hypothetical protein [Yeosuana marina]|uniref:hypothetical protein n=1 Tax=Yeosuana marina TaxID=1565536 RepID=UPI0014246244|nr:hypothetical protein [Yeosuana marina]